MVIKKTIWFWWLVIGYVIASVGLLLFSFTQVDLSLTLSQASIFQFIEQTFQHIGFYERPTATVWYAAEIFLFMSMYAGTIIAIRKKMLDIGSVIVLVILTVILLVLSYPAFSYDVFNYMFTAKTVLVYHKNPYLVIPLQFTGVEPWLSFMHWTHLPSAYTPLWIIMTLPAYLMGFGYFLLTLWNFKILAAAWYLVTVFYIMKILLIQDKKNAALGTAIFALNPVILFETLVSAHNDISMMAFAMMSVYYFMVNKKTLSYLLLALSVGAKLMTVFLYPVIAFGFRKFWALAAMSLGLVLVLFQREFLPWYFVWIVPFVALIPESGLLVTVASGISAGLLLRYAPYFYYGNFGNPVPLLQFWVTVVPIALSLAGYLFYRLLNRRKLTS